MQAMVLEKACIQCGLCAGLCPEVSDSCPVAAIQVTA